MNILEKIQKIICCIPTATFPTPYEFDFNGNTMTIQNQNLFESNYVRTSKYAWYTFLFKALLIQFYRVANIYFLIIAILQTIPQISPYTPVTAWLPLIVVLGISMLRQGYEDFGRHQEDNAMNYQSKTLVRRNGAFQEINWSQVVVGDICKIMKDQMFPADLILITSEAEGGIAFIETASLDGQKNLKPRNAFQQTIPFKSDQNLNKLQGRWLGIPPDKQLHKFSSKMQIGSNTIVFEGDKQLLYRGARLKNTEWVYGLAIYTGMNTKIMMNSDSSSQKMSQIQRKVNIILIFILIIQFILCILMGILFGVFRTTHEDTASYIIWSGYNSATDSVIAIFAYLVLLNTLIPISLVVSIQIVKFSQSYFINNDRLMYSDFRKKFSHVKTASLNEELGQIQYVFSDKTGTLTMNIMQFKIACIGTKMYGDLTLLSKNPNLKGNGEKGFKDQRLKALLQTGMGNQNLNEKITIKNKQGGQIVSLGNMRQLAEQYFQALSTAHEVVVVANQKTGIKSYEGPSPDEITLVDAAKEMQFQFVRSTQATTTISIRGNQKTFDLLEVFSFTSDRKRMSVIIKSGGIIKMYTKGADSIVKARLAKDQYLNLDDQLYQFSKIGLRTLLVAMRTISEQQYSNFKKAVQILPSTNKQQAFNALVSELETNLYLIGATAVLDRLQQEVPQTIRDLIRANIKVWMLTGDKMQTAQNIAKSCNLIQPRFEIIKYELPPNTNYLSYLKNLVVRSDTLTQKGTPKAFLIQGSDLTPLLADYECQVQLANLAKTCQSVVCCRLLPIQKAQVVSLVRTHLNKITLSIGDGANDVPMIKTAHVGVGLSGQQGMGAVQASDYALPQFRMLWRLLLVHGRWNYIRISEMILYFFYKNMLFTLPQFIYGFYSGYSSQTVFDDIYVALYNLLFTSIPLIVKAVLEQDVNYIIATQLQESKRQEQFRESGRPQRQTRQLERQNNNLQQFENTATFEHNNTAIELQPKKLAKIQQTKKINPPQIKIKTDKKQMNLPSQYKVNKYFYRLFPKLYFVGQQNCIFNYTNYALWMAEALVQSVMITLFTIYIIGQISIGVDGYNSDFWLGGITIFTIVILMVTIKLATHTKFWSILFVFSVLITSIIPYIAYMWISNYIPSSLFYTNYMGATAIVYWTKADTYFLTIFFCCFLLALDGVVVYIDYIRGGYASKMREIIKTETDVTKSTLQQMSIRLTDGLTLADRRQSSPKVHAI